MKNLIIMALVAGLLFAVSAAISLYLNQPKPAEDAADKSKKKDKDTPKEKEPDEMPKTVRPGAITGTAEESLKIAEQYKQLQDAVAVREAKVARRENQVKLVLEDIRGEREVLDGLRKQLTNELKVIGDRSGDVDSRFRELEKEKEIVSKSASDAKRQLLDISNVEEKNLERQAKILEGMEAEKAGKVVEEMANSGKLDTVAKILSLMQPRNSSKVLAEIKDTTLVAQVVDRMRAVKRGGSPMP